MTHLGVYYAPEHTIPADLDYIAKLQPPVIRLLDPDVQQIATMHTLAPGAIVAPRTWAIDDNSGQAVRDLMMNPVVAGQRHAERYRAQLDQWKQEASERGIVLPADDRIYFNAANEPNQGGTPDKIAAYTVAFLNRCTELGIHATGLCLGVGWPDNTGPDTPVNWQPYAAIVEPIQRGGHFLELHEYFYKDGPQNNWTWWAGRHLQCPFNVPILLGEVGCDNYVDKARWDKEGGNRGWQGNMSPDQYGDQVAWHIGHSDKRVVAALVFITDFRNREWESFNTRAAHGAFLARKDAMIPQTQPPAPTVPTTPPFTTHLPSVPNQPGKTMYVSAVSGLNLRSAPVTGAILAAVPYGDAVQVFTTEASGGVPWSQVVYGGMTGWMFASLLSATPPTATAPAPQPEQPATGDCWQRSIEWVLAHEGGYQDNPADVGNWTGGKVGIGENKGTNFGISAASYPTLDIKNLTREQAIAIYERDYWIPSGASTLPYPACLIAMDTAVLHGVGTAQRWLAEVGASPYAIAAKRLRTYVKLANWKEFGAGWVNRTADLLEKANEA